MDCKFRNFFCLKQDKYKHSEILQNDNNNHYLLKKFLILFNTMQKHMPMHVHLFDLGHPLLAKFLVLGVSDHESTLN